LTTFLIRIFSLHQLVTYKFPAAYFRVWGQTVEAVDCGEAAANWIDKYLDASGLRILYHADSMARRRCDVGASLWHKSAKPEDQVWFLIILKIYIVIIEVGASIITSPKLLKGVAVPMEFELLKHCFAGSPLSTELAHTHE